MRAFFSRSRGDGALVIESPKLRCISSNSDGETSLSGQGTFQSSVVTLSAMAMGCGVLSLPKVFALCGVLGGLFFLALFAWWVESSLRWLVACGRYSGKSSFRDNAKFYLGHRGARVVHGGQLLLLFGGTVTVFITAASLLPCIHKDVLESLCVEGAQSPTFFGFTDLLRGGLCWAHPASCIPRGQVTALVALLVFPLACLESLHALRSFSSIGLACLGYFFLVLLLRLGSVCAISAHTFLSADASHSQHLQVDPRLPPRLLPPFETSFWQGPPIVLMSLLCHTSILKLDTELRPDMKARIGSVISTVIIRIALPAYAIVGLGGYLLHGAGVSSNVLQDFRGDGLMALARLTLGVLNMIKIPMAAVTIREDLIDALAVKQWRRRLREPLGRTVVTAIVISSAAVAGHFLGSLSYALSLMGCTVGVLFSLCLPAVLYWKLLGLVALERSGTGDDDFRVLEMGQTRSLQEPLMRDVQRPGGTATKRSHLDSVSLQRARALSVLAFPRTVAGRRWHRFVCALVFFGGLLVGCLGLVSWVFNSSAS